MKLQFQADLTYQNDAIAAVVDLFEGQPVGRSPPADWLQVQASAFANRWSLSADTLQANLRRVQARHGIRPSEDGLQVTPSHPDAPDPVGGIPHFTVEMETGTGKTYVYLRTIHALHQRYGWTKFIVVVPSVAIREGVKASLGAMREHFGQLYGRVPLEARVYSSKEVARLRHFAHSNQLQVLILNIDAFNKSTNVLHSEDRDLPGVDRPIELIQQARPVVILDEPQNMESARSAAAIASLHPLCTLRYSATHRNTYNLVYRLGPVAAYDHRPRLVKQLEVDSVLDEEDFNRPFLEVVAIETRRSGPPVAKVRLDVQQKGGPKRKTITLQASGEDLFTRSNGRETYRGYVVDEIHAAHGFVSFTNGLRLQVGEATGNHADDVMKAQIRRTVREHFEKELRISRLPADEQMKVLSLFFIDRVAHYAPADGKLRRWFEDAYTELAGHPAYRSLPLPPVDQVHGGYFAQDRKGVARDTKTGRSKADDDAYQLILRDKERLLSREEPLRFLFSHSALREGWDNPNVFQICTLQASHSELKKRQEIGRGLRLPVRYTGERCWDEALNTLTLIANESYDEFARKLQTELEEDCGESFEGRLRRRSGRRTVRRKALPPEFAELWQRIRQKTVYAVRFTTDALVEEATRAVGAMPAIAVPKLVTRRAAIGFDAKGTTQTVLSVREEALAATVHPIPDLLAHLQHETRLTRSTLARILVGSGRLDDVPRNPQQFLDHATKAIQRSLHRQMVDGIEYLKRSAPGGAFEAVAFAPEVQAWEQRLLNVQNSLYDAIEVDSMVERVFARALDAREDIRFFLKLPGWFKVPTPIGHYNPDWAIVLDRDERVFLVRETKGTSDIDALPPAQRDKLRCGLMHFRHLGVDFAVVTNADEVR
jgi:type III restriction enzyme